MDLVNKLLNYYKLSKSNRRLKEMEWINNLQQFKQKYPPDILARIRQMNGSEVYPNYTRSKVKPTISKINNIFFPSGMNAWNISPKKFQKLPQFILDKVNATVSNLDGDVTQDQLVDLIQSILYDYKREVDEVIKDQFSSMDFENVFKKVNYSAVMYGTGILKGIMTTHKRIFTQTIQNGAINQNEVYTYTPYVEYIPIWNIYPDTSTFEKEKISYIFQLHKVNKEDLLRYSVNDDFDINMIKSYINEHPYGDYVKENWETELELLSTEQTQKDVIANHYKILEYWGYLDGDNFTEENIQGSVFVNVWILGNKIIRKQIYDDIDKPDSLYHFFYYEKDDSSIFGTGLPYILKGTQLTISASARMILDNASSIAGDQLEVNLDLLSDGQDVSSFHPRKIWYREGRGQESQYPAIRPISFNSHISEFINIISLFKQFGDEESNLPAFIWGSSEQLPANTTATGMTQLNDNTNLSLSDIVKDYEKEGIKILQQLIDWNRKYNTNKTDAFSIDYVINGFGYNSFREKNGLLIALSQFNNSIRPEDTIWIKKDNLFKHQLSLLGIPFDDIIKSKREVMEEMQQQQQDQEVVALSKENMAADIEYTKAKAANMLAKSKLTLDKSKNDTILSNKGGGA